MSRPRNALIFYAFRFGDTVRPTDCAATARGVRIVPNRFPRIHKVTALRENGHAVKIRQHTFLCSLLCTCLHVVGGTHSRAKVNKKFTFVKIRTFLEMWSFFSKIVTLWYAVSRRDIMTASFSMSYAVSIWFIWLGRGASFIFKMSSINIKKKNKKK